MVVLQVFPESQRQRGGQAGQGVVVDAGLAFAQVVHEQVADGTAGQVVAVDELLDGELPGERVLNIRTVGGALSGKMPTECRSW